MLPPSVLSCHQRTKKYLSNAREGHSSKTMESHTSALFLMTYLWSFLLTLPRLHLWPFSHTPDWALQGVPTHPRPWPLMCLLTKNSVWQLILRKTTCTFYNPTRRLIVRCCGNGLCTSLIRARTLQGQVFQCALSSDYLLAAMNEELYLLLLHNKKEPQRHTWALNGNFPKHG